MNTEGLQIVRIDYEATDLPESVQQSHPVVYRENDQFCCILGPDQTRGIFGRGATLATALSDFDQHYKRLLEHPIIGDPVSEFIHHRHV